jgi:hypothetical protein
MVQIHSPPPISMNQPANPESKPARYTLEELRRILRSDWMPPAAVDAMEEAESQQEKNDEQQSSGARRRL